MNKIKLKRKRYFVIILLFILLCLSISTRISKSETAEAQYQSDLESVKVAVYGGIGSLDSSRIALENMFKWMNATVTTITSDDISYGNLVNFDILVYPGGATSSYSYLIGEEGREAIRQFLFNGGSLFGICGGAVFGVSSLNLVDGAFMAQGSGVARGTYMMKMNVNRESAGPDLSNEPDSYSTLFWESKYYYSNNKMGIIPIMLYPHNNEAAMIAFKYGTGTVFLCYPHPEYEENSDRDGSSAFDHLDDPDSEWGLLLKVSLWLVEDSPTNLWAPIGISLAIIIPIAGVGVGVLVVLIKRRS